jgi:hypothetical protein
VQGHTYLPIYGWEPIATVPLDTDVMIVVSEGGGNAYPLGGPLQAHRDGLGQFGEGHPGEGGAHKMASTLSALGAR